MNKVQNIVLLGLLLVISGLVFGFSFSKHKNQRFNAVNIQIDEAHNSGFINQSYIEKMLQHNGNYIMQQVVDSVDVQHIEDVVNADPYVKSATAFTEITGAFNINVTPRVPIVRILNENGGGFYIDSDGYSIPLSNTSTARVVPCTGLKGLGNDWESQNKDVSETPKLHDVYKLAEAIVEDKLLSKQIVQIDIDDKKQVTLIPRVGNHEIVFGKIENIETKFQNLKQFYQSGIEQTNWNIYKSIDLSFDGQVVCKRR